MKMKKMSSKKENNRLYIYDILFKSIFVLLLFEIFMRYFLVGKEIIDSVYQDSINYTILSLAIFQMFILIAKKEKKDSFIPSYKKIIKAICVLSIICLFILVSGLIINYRGVPKSGVYAVEKVKVLDIVNNKLKIDVSGINNNEKDTALISKPFYTGVSKGDIINVGFNLNGKEQMHYVMDARVGLVLMKFACNSLFFLLFILAVVSFAFLTVYFIYIPYKNLKL